MDQDHAEDVVIVLAQHMVRLFDRHKLTAAQTKNLLEKVRVLVKVGEGATLTTPR